MHVRTCLLLASRPIEPPPSWGAQGDPPWPETTELVDRTQGQRWVAWWLGGGM